MGRHDITICHNNPGQVKIMNYNNNNNDNDNDNNNKQLLDEVFEISGIIKVEESANSQAEGWGWGW